MKTLNTSLSALLLFILAGCSDAGKPHHSATVPAGSAAATTVTPEPGAPSDSIAEMKAWENYMTPGHIHKWLALQDGKWKGKIVSWAAPDVPPTPSEEVSAENKMVLGGRYQESVYKGKMMGMDFEGHGLMAYDNAKKKIVNIWIDNMGTGVMYTEGSFDEISKQVNLTGKMTDPVTGRDTDVRQVFRIIDDKNQVMELYCTRNGKEFKNMELTLTKK